MTGPFAVLVQAFNAYRSLRKTLWGLALPALARLPSQPLISCVL